MEADRHGPQQVRRARRLSLSLLLSLLAHALLLSLALSGQEFGLPGFAFPWQERRIQVPDLRVELVPAPVTDPKPGITPDPLPSASIAHSVAAGQASVTFKSPEQRPARPARTIAARSTPAAKASPKQKKPTPPPSASALASSAPPSKQVPSVIALEQSDEPEFVVPPPPPEPAPAVPAASGSGDGGVAAQPRSAPPGARASRRGHSASGSRAT